METKRSGGQIKHPTTRTSHRSHLLSSVWRIKKTTVLIAVTVLITGIIVVANWSTATPNAKRPTGQKDAATPQYQTVLPSGKSIKDLGGWKKLTPPDGNSFYTYTDSIDGIPVNVSQQQLPKAFQSNTNEKVAELAKSYNATTKLNVNGLTVYIGKSAKGPQSVIFARDNLLVFIKSERKVVNSAWKHYITSLGVPSSTGSTTY